MNAERHKKVKELHARALDRNPSERSAFLEAACGPDSALREEVESLLSARERMGRFLDTPAPERVRRIAAPRLEPGQRIGHHEIVKIIAAGGGGTVYEALQENPRRKVALKVLGVGSEAGLRRFHDEAQILAQLQHPSIATVFEAGIHDEGVPWFAMEFVEGARTVTQYGEDLPVRERLDLMTRVCDAVHHGHQKGIIHRDIKPGNVLVDSSGRPKIIDFGIAKLVEDGGAGSEMAGTVPYLSPEQCAPEQDGIDIRSDVYSLGVVAYELLTGRLPHDVASDPVAVAARRIREEPPAPARTGRADVDAILQKALRKNPDDRYGSAAALGDDIRRYLTHRPVEARAPGFFYQLGKFARRQRVAFLAVTALVLVSVAAAAVSGWMAYEKERERVDAERSAYVANIAAAEAALRVDDVAEARQRLEETPPRLRNWEWRHLHHRLDASVRTIAAGHQVRAGAVSRAAGWFATSDGKAPYTVRVWDATGPRVRFDPRKPGGACALALSPDGNLLAVGYGGRDGRDVSIHEAATGKLVVETAGHASDVNAVAFDPTGRTLASVSRDRTVKLWDVPSGRLLRTLEGHEDRVVCAAFDPKTGRLATGGREGTIRLWDPAGGHSLGVWRGHEGSVDGVAFGPDGSRLASVGRDLTVRIWNTATGALVTTSRGHKAAVIAVAFSPDGDTVASASYDKTARLWSAADGRALATLRGHTDFLRSVAFRSASELLSFAGDGTVKFWTMPARPDVPTLRGHEDEVRSVAFGDDGRLLASGSRDGVVRLWDLETQRAFKTWQAHESAVISLEIIADRKLVSSAADGRRREWSLPGARRMSEAAAAVRKRVARSPDGRVLAEAGDSAIRILDARTREVRATLRGHVSKVLCVAFAPDGTRLVSGGQDGTVRLWDVATWRQVLVLHGHRYRVWCVAFSPDGTRLATGGGTIEAKDSVIRLWEAPR